VPARARHTIGRAPTWLRSDRRQLFCAG
jgi:hypothetical protein